MILFRKKYDLYIKKIWSDNFTKYKENLTKKELKILVNQFKIWEFNPTITKLQIVNCNNAKIKEILI